MIYFSKPFDHLPVVPGRQVAAVVFGASLLAGSAVAQRPTSSAETMVINAAVANMDEASNTAEFTTISVTQGKIHLTAERAHATQVGFQNAQWTFAGRVTISLEPRGSLWADQAIFTYRDGALTQVTAGGAPARFEQHRTDAQRAEQGQADEIVYDVKQGTVRLHGHAQVVDGQSTEISAPTFVYRVRDDKWQALSEGGAHPVHITTRPTSSIVP